MKTKREKQVKNKDEDKCMQRNTKLEIKGERNEKERKKIVI